MLDGRTVGRHYAGPTWEHVDGSSVQAKVIGNAPGATANDVPWLKLEVVERRGTGALAGADIIQRINTAGGVLHGPCERAGSLRSVGYSADYVFRRKDRYGGGDLPPRDANAGIAVAGARGRAYLTVMAS